MVFDLILLQAFHTGEDICSTVPQDVAKAALCECALDYDFYSPLHLYDQALTCTLLPLLRYCTQHN